jgi:sortase A
LQAKDASRGRLSTVVFSGLFSIPRLDGDGENTMRRMRKLEWLLLAFGVSMLSIYVAARIHGFILSRAEVERFKSQRLLAQELYSGAEARGKSPDFSLWSAKRIQGYQQSLASHFAPGIAVLRIPKIGLEVPVLEGTDDLNLNRALGHISGTARPGENGNIGIAGHRDGFFRGLKDVVIGDSVEIMTQTETSTYAIDEILIVDPSDVTVLAPRSHSSLTLVTCYPFYFVGSAPQRYIVHASLTKMDIKELNRSKNASLK